MSRKGDSADMSRSTADKIVKAIIYRFRPCHSQLSPTATPQFLPNLAYLAFSSGFPEWLKTLRINGVLDTCESRASGSNL